jgi:glyoxylase-like metal-dependent hydrolase (beta-lactamase superfamily II)
MASDRDDRLPPWLLWSERPFPDTNLLLLPGRHPAMIDSGFVGHADQTAERASAQLGQVELVVNTHWHSDHVGGNARMQSAGAGIAASLPDSEAVNRRDPGCCVAEYLDQPVAAYTVDQALSDDDTLHLGDTEWEVIATPGHTQGHLCLWQPEDRILAVGDALSP